MLSGGCCVSIADNREAAAVPATLEVTRNTWQGPKGLNVVLAPGLRGSAELCASRNLFAVDNVFVMFWPLRGPRSLQSPGMARRPSKS